MGVIRVLCNFISDAISEVTDYQCIRNLKEYAYLVSDDLSDSLDVHYMVLPEVCRRQKYYKKYFKEYLFFISILRKRLKTIFTGLKLYNGITSYETEDFQIYKDEVGWLFRPRTDTNTWHEFYFVPTLRIHSDLTVSECSKEERFNCELIRNNKGDFIYRRIEPVTIKIYPHSLGMVWFENRLKFRQTVESFVDFICSSINDFICSYNSYIDSYLKECNRRYLLANLSVCTDKSLRGNGYRAYDVYNRAKSAVFKDFENDILSFQERALTHASENVKYTERVSLSVNDVESVHKKLVNSNINLSRMCVGINQKIKLYISHRLLYYGFKSNAEGMLFGRLVSVQCNRGLSYIESEEVLRIMKQFNFTLTGVNSTYLLIDLPFTSLSLVSFIGQCWLDCIRGGKRVLSSKNVKYNTETFVEHFKEFCIIMCKFAKMSEGVYEMYSDVIDYLLFHFKESDFYTSEIQYNTYGLSMLQNTRFGLRYDGNNYFLVNFSTQLDGVDKVY